MGKHDDGVRMAGTVIVVAIGVAAFLYVLWVGAVAVLWNWA